MIERVVWWGRYLGRLITAGCQLLVAVCLGLALALMESRPRRRTPPHR